MKNNSQEVIIVGSGFAGLIAAITLKQLDIPFKIFEATESPVNIGGSLTMFPNSMKVLRLIGLADIVIEHGVLMKKIKFQNNFGKHLVYRPQGTKNIYGEPTITIRRSKLQEIILSKMKELGIEIYYNKKLSEISENTDSVTLHFDDSTKVNGSIVIGCDGINSVVRKHVLKKEILPEYSGLLFVGGFVKNKQLIYELDLDYNTQYVSVGPTSWFAYSHIDNPEKKEKHLLWYCYLSQPKRLQKKDLLTIEDKEFLNKVLSFHKSWHHPIQKLVENTYEICKANVSDIVEIEKWYRGRSIVIGDAAHAMNPISGQGAGTAMEDGFLIANLIGIHKYNYESTFEDFVKLRKERTTKIARKARKSSKRTTIHFNKYIVMLRNITFALLTYLTPEKILNKNLLYDVEEELNKIK
jgi:2-polyprenyl-6-methoxyphenol hydroxylase-like FAD-dependent oxidoreductase